MPRDLATLAFVLEVVGQSDSALQLEFRLWRGSLEGSWQPVPVGGAMLLTLADHLEVLGKPLKELHI